MSKRVYKVYFCDTIHILLLEYGFPPKEFLLQDGNGNIIMDGDEVYWLAPDDSKWLITIEDITNERGIVLTLG